MPVELRTKREGRYVVVGFVMPGADAPFHVDRINPVSATARAACVKRLRGCANGKADMIDFDQVEAALLSLAEQQPATEASAPAPSIAPPTRAALLEQHDAEIARALEMTPHDIVREAADLLQAPDILDRIASDIAAMGVAGERGLAMLVYLLGTSRLLDQPLAAIVRGPSSSGKSHVIASVAKLFPEEAKVLAHAMSEQALYYRKPGSLMHRVVFAGERSLRPEEDVAAAGKALREMVSDGELRKEVVSTASGIPETISVYQPGPIAHVESTTKDVIFAEDRNRCLVLDTDDGALQTERVLVEVANAAAMRDQAPRDRIVAVHHAVQRLLARVQVRVPFALDLLSAIPSARTEARRVGPMLVNVVRAVALLRQRQRGAGIPSHGDVVDAAIDDYAAARPLLLDPLGRSLGLEVAPRLVRFGDELRSHFGDRTFDSSEARAHFQDWFETASTVTDYLGKLLRVGCVVLVEASAGASPARWRCPSAPPRVAADWLPDAKDLLPAPGDAVR